MRRPAGIAVVIAAALAGPARASEIVPAPGAPPPPPCLRTGETVAASGPFTAVLRLGGRLVACDRQTGARRLMVRAAPAVPNAGGGAYRVTVAGSLVAYAEYAFCTVCGGGDTDRLRLFSLRRGRERSLDAIHTPLSSSFDVRVRAIALNECGAVAFVSAARERFSARDTDRELHLWTRDGTELLERGPIALGSLRVTGSRVAWRSGGALRGRSLAVGCAYPAD